MNAHHLTPAAIGAANIHTVDICIDGCDGFTPAGYPCRCVCHVPVDQDAAAPIATFTVGQRVTHPRLGTGTVIELVDYAEGPGVDVRYDSGELHGHVAAGARALVADRTRQILAADLGLPADFTNDDLTRVLYELKRLADQAEVHNAQTNARVTGSTGATASTDVTLDNGDSFTVASGTWSRFTVMRTGPGSWGGFIDNDPRQGEQFAARFDTEQECRDWLVTQLTR